MEDLIVAKASPVGTEPVPSVILRIQAEVPEFLTEDNGGLLGLTIYYDSQAELVMRALSSLPGGTLDRVLALLIARCVSLHRIPWDSTEKK